MTVRFIDSNIFIYHLAGDERYGETASRIVYRISKGEKAAASTLIFSQVLAYLRWKNRASIIPKFIDFLRSLPTIQKVETNFDDLILARKLQEKAGVDWKAWDDLIVAAQMLRMGVTEIYSNDKDFDAIPNVKRIFF
ncbi:type II toxin-antitoxin system VapC family toxin [Candidatus Hecatella orcuttiae]|jgi:predicted nucleic acid-binding protein|uniref:type II toxin-antitoxin system VapC family toxin n=1 Tax=Candidatus Hecatella orcuttiae TaxID=1935119 RepID=UPI00286804F0|nr:type II toxin-antitoxin system VapC family toxin [Candidatus Hecatella orcuttiae]